MSDNITALNERIMFTKARSKVSTDFDITMSHLNQLAIMSAQVEILQRLTPKDPEEIADGFLSGREEQENKPSLCRIPGCGKLAVAGEGFCLTHFKHHY